MFFWWYMLGIDLLISGAMIAGGLFMWKRTPKKINAWLGYRTERSMKNADTWRFANEYSGRRMCKTGLVFLTPSVLALILVYGKPESTVSTVGLVMPVIELVCVFVSIHSTENALKSAFNDDGTRKE